MTTQTYTTRTGTQQYRPVLTEREYLELNNENMGFCLACGNDVPNVEPDAKQYPCEQCGWHKVYGLEELMVMGLVKLAV